MNSTERTVALIQQLNDPGHANNAHSISRELQNLQLSGDGWSIGDGLLSSDNATLQFYGALTFQIKLNREADTLDIDVAYSVLQRLLTHFSNAVDREAPDRVLDKICSALATFAVRAVGSWPSALAQAMSCLIYGPEDQVRHDSVDPAGLVTLLSTNQLLAVIRLGRIMCEDLGKLEGETQKQFKVEEAFKTNVHAFVALITIVLSSMDMLSQKIIAEALQTYKTLSSFAGDHWSHDGDTLSMLNPLTDAVLNALASQDISLLSLVAESLSVVMGYPALVSKPQLTRLRLFIPKLIQVDPVQSEQGANVCGLMTSWAKKNLETIVANPEDTFHQTLLQHFASTVDRLDWTDGHLTLLWIITEFWSDFTEIIAERTKIENDEQLRQILLTINKAYFRCLDAKDEELMRDLDDDDLEEWKRLRQDFSELMATNFEIDLFSPLDLCASELEQALRERNWHRVETVLYLLNEIVHEYSGTESNPRGEIALGRIFDSEIFSIIVRPNGLDQLSMWITRQLVRFIDNYSFFFRQRQAQIPAAMTWLMNLMNHYRTSRPTLADLAARCFGSLCSACRSTLVPMLSDLMAFCDQALRTASISAYQKDKIYSGVAYVIQALSRESDKVDPVSGLLDRIQDDLEKARKLITVGQMDIGGQEAVTALQCLAATGKALHSEPMHVIILDDDDDNKQADDSKVGTSSVWSTPRGQATTMKTVNCLQIIDIVPKNGEAWDEVCAVLRVGLSEREPGPFVLPFQLVASFLASMTLETPRLEALLTTACTFLSATQRASTDQNLKNEIELVSASVVRVMLSVQDPAEDPQISQLATDYLERLLDTNAEVLLSMSAIPQLLDFQLRAMMAAEATPMLKRAVAAFLSALLELPRNISSFGKDSVLANAATNLSDQLVPPLANVIAHQLGGNAARSDLEAVAKLVRALMAASPRWRGLLERALSEGAPGWPEDSKAGAQDKAKFIGKLGVLRGGRGTADAVREFWAVSRGTISGF